MMQCGVCNVNELEVVHSQAANISADIKIAPGIVLGATPGGREEDSICLQVSLPLVGGSNLDVEIVAMLYMWSKGSQLLQLYSFDSFITHVAL